MANVRTETTSLLFSPNGSEDDDSHDDSGTPAVVAGAAVNRQRSAAALEAGLLAAHPAGELADAGSGVDARAAPAEVLASARPPRRTGGLLDPDMEPVTAGGARSTSAPVSTRAAMGVGSPGSISESIGIFTPPDEEARPARSLFGTPEDDSFLAALGCVLSAARVPCACVLYAICVLCALCCVYCACACVLYAVCVCVWVELYVPRVRRAHVESHHAPLLVCFV